MTISGERTKHLDIFCHVTGFTDDFLSFIDVELIRFFHGALRLLTWLSSESFTASVTLSDHFCCRALEKKYLCEPSNMMSKMSSGGTDNYRKLQIP